MSWPEPAEEHIEPGAASPDIRVQLEGGSRHGAGYWAPDEAHELLFQVYGGQEHYRGAVPRRLVDTDFGPAIVFRPESRLAAGSLCDVPDGHRRPMLRMTRPSALSIKRRRNLPIRPAPLTQLTDSSHHLLLGSVPACAAPVCVEAGVEPLTAGTPEPSKLNRQRPSPWTSP